MERGGLISMVKANYLFHKNNGRNVFIIIISIILLFVGVFLIDHILFLSSISDKMENDFYNSFRQRDINYIDKYFDDNTVFEYKKRTIKYSNAKKNIRNCA